MKNIFTISFVALSIILSAQTYNAAYQNRVNEITQTNINTNLTEFAAFGIKKTGTVINNNAFTWLKNKYLGFGYVESQLSENSFLYQGNATKNLILTKTGTKYPDTFVIVCGHYDTIGGPGVNDNGSGTSIILEMARILKEVPTEYSIKFINFTGEEQGLLGSQNYVSTVVNGTNPKMKIKMVFNIDQVGGVAGKVNNTLTCENDASNPSSNNAASATVTQELINCVGLYSPLQTNLATAYGSDYMPFQSNGEIITGIYEFNESNKPHSANDIYINMDPIFVFNVAKAVLGAVQHFSVAQSAVVLGSSEEIKTLKERVSLYPNPASDQLNIGINSKEFQVQITDFSGKNVLQSKDEQTLDISKLPNGAYLLTVSSNGESVTEKFIVKR